MCLKQGLRREDVDISWDSQGFSGGGSRWYLTCVLICDGPSIYSKNGLWGNSTIIAPICNQKYESKDVNSRKISKYSLAWKNTGNPLGTTELLGIWSDLSVFKPRFGTRSRFIGIQKVEETDVNR